MEDADAIASRPFRISSSGAFGLLDLIGIDLVPHVWASLQRQLPTTDQLWSYDLTSDPLIAKLIGAGAIGRKSGAGFYRLSKNGAERVRETLDPVKFAWRPERPTDAAANSDLRMLCEEDTPLGRFAWRVLSRLALYAASVAPEIANSVAEVDLGMRLGYNWAEGPFEIAERVGLGWLVERLRAENEPIPELLAQAAERGGFYPGKSNAIATAAPYVARKADDPARPLAAIERRIVFENSGAALWDIGDGVACFEHKTKMNIYNEFVFDAIGVALEEVPRGFRAMAIGSDHPRAFSCGADLGFFLGRMKAGDYAALEHFMSYGGERFLALKYAPFPVVGAAFGLALGGGCETLLHMREVVAHAELNAGLPESTLGILPGWGGCVQLAIRATRKEGAPKGPVAALRDPFFSFSVASSAARRSMREKAACCAPQIQFADKSRRISSPEPKRERLNSPTDTRRRRRNRSSCPARRQGWLMSAAHSEANSGKVLESENDLAVAEALATVLTGGAADPLVPMSEREVMKLEREAVLSLARRPAAFARIEHMLATGKPLRN